jgi:hypothetical protein
MMGAIDEQRRAKRRSQGDGSKRAVEGGKKAVADCL